MKKFKSFQDLNIIKEEFNRPIIEKKSDEKSLILKNDYFHNENLENSENSIQTFFNDNQVINLVEKISNRNIRKLLWEFKSIRYEDTDRTFLLKFILHSICNKLLNLYGSRIISFIHDLKISERNEKIVGIHSNIFSIDIEQEDLSFENITVQFEEKKKTIFGEMSTHSQKCLGFEISDYNKKPYMIICNRDGSLEARINELGYVEDDFIKRIRFNIFKMFDSCQLSYYSVAILNERCANPYCRKELTVPESIFYGMGPICRGKFM